jgi:hypothetical protein
MSPPDIPTYLVSSVTEQFVQTSLYIATRSLNVNPFSSIDLVVSILQPYVGPASGVLTTIGSAALAWVIHRLLNLRYPLVNYLPSASPPPSPVFHWIVVHSTSGYVVLLCLTEAANQIIYVIYVLPPST